MSQNNTNLSINIPSVDVGTPQNLNSSRFIYIQNVQMVRIELAFSIDFMRQQRVSYHVAHHIVAECVFVNLKRIIYCKWDHIIMVIPDIKFRMREWRAIFLPEVHGVVRLKRVVEWGFQKGCIIKFDGESDGTINNIAHSIELNTHMVHQTVEETI